MPDIARIVALGASNLTRGFQILVATARAAWGPDVQVLAALGHGRSYGVPNRVIIRTLPGILESGLWRALDSLPPRPTRALVTDVGNDFLYGFTAERTLAWIDEAIVRLQRITRDIVLTDLPLASVKRLSPAKFLMFRSIFFPSCRLPLTRVVEAAEQVNAGLAGLAVARGIKLFNLDPEWYGLDPIHIRPSSWRPAWQKILGAPVPTDEYRSSLLEAIRLYFMPPEHHWLLGVEQFKRQSGTALPAGGRIWLY